MGSTHQNLRTDLRYVLFDSHQISSEYSRLICDKFVLDLLHIAVGQHIFSEAEHKKMLRICVTRS